MLYIKNKSQGHSAYELIKGSGKSCSKKQQNGLTLFKPGFLKTWNMVFFSCTEYT